MMDVSQPNLLFDNPVINGLGMGALYIAILALNYLYAPVTDPLWKGLKTENLYQYLKDAWYGREMLWQVFWPFLVLVVAVFIYIDYRVENINFTIASWRTVHGILFLPFLWWLSAVWVCSRHTRYKAFTVFARSTSQYLLLIGILRVYLSYQYPQLLFDCKLLTLEYGGC